MKAAFKERDWNRLLVEIREKEVIPVLGPELLEIETSTGENQNFYAYITEKLIEALELDEDDLKQKSFTEISDLYVKEGGDKHDIYFEISQICKNADFKIPDAIQKLADISDFTLFITTSFDSYILNALNEKRFKGQSNTNVLAHSSRSEFPDIPLHMGNETYVYHIFGKAGITPDYVVTEEDLLTHVQRMRDSNRRPENLFDQLKAKRLLQLGCNFPNWLERFFVSGLHEGNLSSQGSRTVVADKESYKDSSLIQFFKRHKAFVYPEDSLSFVNELHQRWTELKPAEESETSTSDSETAHFEEGAIFISYASEDVKAAAKLKQVLEGSGLQVWMDKERLEAGDDYRIKIFRNIEKSSFFIPLISKHTLTMDRRFFRLEWNKAQDEANYRPENFPFILPAIIDDSPQGHELIPEYFKAKTHISHFPEGQADEDFLTLCRQRIRELRRKERQSI